MEQTLNKIEELISKYMIDDALQLLQVNYQALMQQNNPSLVMRAQKLFERAQQAKKSAPTVALQPQSQPNVATSALQQVQQLAGQAKNFLSQGKFPDALLVMLQSLKIKLENGMVDQLYATYNNIAGVYTQMQDFTHALSYYQKAEQACVPDTIQMAACYMNQAEVYLHMNLLDMSLTFNVKALALVLKLKAHEPQEKILNRIYILLAQSPEQAMAFVEYMRNPTESIDTLDLFYDVLAKIAKEIKQISNENAPVLYYFVHEMFLMVSLVYQGVIQQATVKVPITEVQALGGNNPKWFEYVIRPVQDLLPQTVELIIVPHGPICSVSFPSLFDSKLQTYFVHRYAISIAPSMRSLKKHRYDILPSQCLCYGASTTDEMDIVEATLNAQPEFAVERVPSSSKQTLLGKLKEQPYNIVHIDKSGAIDATDLSQLTLHQMQLLVITAVKSMDQVTALLNTGVNSVLVLKQDVPADFVAKFCGLFYKNLMLGATKAAALQATQSSLAQENKASPWSSFCLYGLPNAIDFEAMDQDIALGLFMSETETKKQTYEFTIMATVFKSVKQLLQVTITVPVAQLSIRELQSIMLSKMNLPANTHVKYSAAGQFIRSDTAIITDDIFLYAFIKPAQEVNNAVVEEAVTESFEVQDKIGIVNQLFMQQDYESSANLFQEIISMSSTIKTKCISMLNLSMCLCYLKRFKDARVWIEKCLELAPKCDQTYQATFAIAGMYQDMEDWHKAIEMYHLATKSTNNLIEKAYSMSYLGIMYDQKANNVGKALEALGEATTYFAQGQHLATAKDKQHFQKVEMIYMQMMQEMYN